MNSVNSLEPKIAVAACSLQWFALFTAAGGIDSCAKEVELTLFVSVDSSSDGTERWFDRLAENDARVVLLPHGRHFGGAAKNFSGYCWM